METKTVPLQLEQSPIIEAVWQIRFDVANDIAVGDFRIESTPVQIRAEVAEAEYIHTIQIINQAQLTQPSVEQDSALNEAMGLASKYGIAAMDAIHVNTALFSHCDTFYTTEKAFKPMFRVPKIRIISLVERFELIKIDGPQRYPSKQMFLEVLIRPFRLGGGPLCNRARHAGLQSRLGTYKR